MPTQPTSTCRAPRGIVCAVDHLAAQAGLSMLRLGGTAADAAVAASAVLAVTTQHLCGMGGDLLAVVVPPGDRPLALNSSGRAGSGADPDGLRADGHTVMPARGDIRSVTIPGCVDGWLALHKRFGRLPLADVMGPARDYASDGFPASPTLAASVATVAYLPDAADYTGAGIVKAGTIIRRPGAARTLAAIVAEGRAGFYQGEFGEGLVKLGAGEFSASDLARQQADWVDALGSDGFGHHLWTVPPNSQGYLTLAGAWIASGLDLPSDPDDAGWAHLLIEAARQAAYDRLAVLHEAADGTSLLDPVRLAPRLAAVDTLQAARLGDTYAEGGTIALTAVDEERLGICVVQSNAAGFGSHLIVPGLRIFLQNRGVGFSLEPGHPGEYRPGRRPAHTLCPTAVTNPDGTLAGVLGTMGGDSQPQILLQLLARWLVGREAPGDAVAAGRWAMAATGEGGGFDTWRGRGVVRVLLEGHAAPGWHDGLKARGHVVVDQHPFSHGFGHAHLISVDGDHLAGGSDPRPRFGAAVGY
jgi:gamma-glutamyltranspeptidase / glutathione hydrolase